MADQSHWGAEMARTCAEAGAALQRLASLLWAEGNPELPASKAEPECGCSLYARCDTHETRPRGCACNGPIFASSACRILEHATVARAHPDRDPALID